MDLLAIVHGKELFLDTIHSASLLTDLKLSSAVCVLMASPGEVGAFYWTVSAPDIVNSGREEQDLVSV